MTHKRHPKNTSKQVLKLVTGDTEDQKATKAAEPVVGQNNKAKTLSMQHKEEIRSIILSRHDSVKDVTDNLAAKMVNWDKQYNGEWQDGTHDTEDHIYLGKTREKVQVVHSFLVNMIHQLPNLVTFKPAVSGSLVYDEEWERAKVAEALVNYYLDDMWHVRDDILPRWIKTFLKYPLAIIKVSYDETSYEPDIRFDVIDRARIYVDPNAQDLRDASWLIEKDHLTRAAIEDNFEKGVWHKPPEWEDAGPANIVDSGDITINRMFGRAPNINVELREDELVEVAYYWQAPKAGLQSVYAVIIGGVEDGGQLVYYGENPLPYKGIPYRGKAYDQHEWKVDGTSLVEIYKSMQEVANTLFNMRTDDILANMQNPTFTDARLFDQTTLDDIKNRSQFPRMNPNGVDAIIQNQGRVADSFFQPKTGTSTDGIFTDMAFALNQGDENTNIGDIFSGQSPQKESTLGEVMEVLSRNMGVFRPVWLQVMRLVEEISEIALEYFKDANFFSENRIISIIGPNKYSEAIKGFTTTEDGRASFRAIGADEMDVDVIVDATSGADQLQARSFTVSSIATMFQSLGAVPGLFEEIRGEFDMAAIFKEMLNVSGQDVEGLLLTEQQKQAKQQEKEQQRQQQIKEQMQITQAVETAKAQIKAEADAMVAKAKESAGSERDLKKIFAEHQAKMEEQVAKINEQHVADTELQLQQFQESLLLMVKEQQLEIESLKAGFQTSVASASNKLSQPSTKGT